MSSHSTYSRFTSEYPETISSQDSNSFVGFDASSWVYNTPVDPSYQDTFSSDSNALLQHTHQNHGPYDFLQYQHGQHLPGPGSTNMSHGSYIDSSSDAFGLDPAFRLNYPMPQVAFQHQHTHHFSARRGLGVSSDSDLPPSSDAPHLGSNFDTNYQSQTWRFKPALGPGRRVGAPAEGLSALQDQLEQLSGFLPNAEQPLNAPPHIERMIAPASHRGAPLQSSGRALQALRPGYSVEGSSEDATSLQAGRPNFRMRIARVPRAASSRASEASSDRFICTQCGVDVGRSGDLIRHQQSFHGEFHYQCNGPSCFHRTARRDKMREHRRTRRHRGQDPEGYHQVHNR